MLIFESNTHGRVHVGSIDRSGELRVNRPWMTDGECYYLMDCRNASAKLTVERQDGLVTYEFPKCSDKCPAFYEDGTGHVILKCFPTPPVIYIRPKDDER